MVRALDAFKANLEQAYEVRGSQAEIEKEVVCTDGVSFRAATEVEAVEESIFRSVIKELIQGLTLDELKDIFYLKKTDPKGKSLENMNSTEVKLSAKRKILFEASVKIRKGGARV
jgi:hypothetical protein